MKIVIDEKIPFIEGRISGAETVMMKAGDINRKAVADADALIVRTRTRCDAALLAGSRVKAVATATIGTDHIDLAWCAANGIAVSNAPGCNAPGVALYVWASLLKCGFDPLRSVLGVVGCGNVGSIVAQWGRRLGVRVLVCDPPKKLRGCADHDYLPLMEVLTKSDAVTLHTPLTRGGEFPTFHMICGESLKHLKPGAMLVNAARGEVTETRALCDAISNGRISKAIIDTWEGEPDIDRSLLSLTDVATCHIAGYSVEGKQRATRMALEAIGKIPGIRVDTEGLCGPYVEPEELTPEMIVRHFDPAPLTSALKEGHGVTFETLRNSYPLHSEIE